VTPARAPAVLVAFLLLVVAFLAAGCGPALPRDAVALANAEEAAGAVLGSWHQDRALPAFYGVPADPACARTLPDGSRALGFVYPESGRCVGGFTDPDAGVFLLLHPEVRYSHNLAHELAHWIRGDRDHRLRGVWEPPLGEADTNLVPAANAWLRAHPALDVVVTQ
jgi:hypothetical protein